MITAASTGNAASSVSLFAACAGLRVVVLVTGNGLKDVATAIRAVERQPVPVEAELSSVLAALES